MSQNNPCLQCGACCAAFRVSFYWRETDLATDNGVPSILTEPVNQFYSCMKGTQDKPPRCVALDGEIGQSVSCRIYHQRSSTCRQFDIVDEQGQINAQCTKARAKYGLLPVKLLD